MPSKCGLCLAYCPSLSEESENLRQIMDKVFYFEIFRSQDSLTLICEACQTTVQEFFEYAEKVSKNQLFLQESMVPSTSNGAITKLEIDHQMDNFPGDGNECNDLKIKDEVFYEVETYVETNYSKTNEAVEKDGKITIRANQVWMTEEIPEEQDDLDEEALDDDLSESHEIIDFETEHGDVGKAAEEKSGSNTKEEKTAVNPKSDVEAKLLQHYKLSCDLCSEPLANFSDLMKHFKHIHNEQGYLKCCNKKITKKCWMIEHIQVHMDPDAFHCAICKKSYSSSRVLKEHTKEVHTPNEQRAIKCETCHKPFATQRALGAHLMVAHGSIPCPQCPKLLASQGSLKKHLIMMHGEGEQFVCDFCARVFRSKPCFDKHVKLHLGTYEAERVQCNLCHAWLTNKYCLRQHMRRIHTDQDEVVACGECGRLQRNKVMLKLHMSRAHGESRFECDICYKKFKRSHHMREHKAIHHTGEDLYGCDYCDERFNNKNKQCIHRKTCHPLEFEEEMRKRAMKEYT